VCVCVRACVRACVCVCVCARARVCVCVWSTSHQRSFQHVSKKEEVRICPVTQLSGRGTQCGTVPCGADAGTLGLSVMLVDYAPSTYNPRCAHLPQIQRFCERHSVSARCNAHKVLRRLCGSTAAVVQSYIALRAEGTAAETWWASAARVSITQVRINTTDHRTE
jgi:hypothetical protein